MTSVAPWTQRPSEEAILLNPVFLGTLIDRVATGYRGTAGAGLPWTLIYVALPTVLHYETRLALPSTTTTSMAAWTRANLLLVEGVTTRAPALRRTVREALLFALSHGLVARTADRLEPGGRARRGPTFPWREPTNDYKACAQKATFFGRWCASAGTPATVFAFWGLKP